MSPDPQRLPPGWYSDPRNSAQERYWDGSDWTNQIRNPPKTSGGSGSGVIGWYRRLPKWVQIGAPIIVVLIIIGAVAGGGEKKKSGSSESNNSASETKPVDSTSSGGGGDSSSSGEGESELSGDPSENASGDNTPVVGPNGSVEVDTLRWHLKSAETTKTIGDQEYGLGSKANGIYVVAHLSVENNKSESVTLTSEVVNLVAGEATYSSNTQAETALIGEGESTFFLEDLGPEVTAKGTVVFDVAPGVLQRHPKLQFNELGFGDTHGYIILPPLKG